MNHEINKIKFLFFLIFLEQTTAFIKAPSWKHCIKTLHALPKEWLSIESPGFPNGMSSQIQCTWMINSNPRSKIRLAFQDFNLTGSVNNCYTQYIEIFDMKRRTSLGKMCGTKRAGDLVSFGNELRIDLLADTSNFPHQGFRLKYKQTTGKDKSGFQTRFSFPKGGIKRKGKRAGKKTANKKPVGKKPAGKKPVAPEKPSSPAVGGRISLASLVNRQKAREMAKINAAKPKIISNTTNENSTVAKLQVTRRTTTTRKTFLINNYNKMLEKMRNDENDDDDDDDDETELSDYFIISVAVGGGIFLIFLVILVKLCFFSDKEEPKKEVYENYPFDNIENPISPSELFRESLKRNNYPVKNLHQLPAHFSDLPLYDTIDHHLKEKDDKHHHKQSQTYLDAKSTTSTKKQKDAAIYQPPTSITQAYILDRKPKKRSKTRKKHPPTLKRKLCQWEKDQLKIEARKLKQTK